MTKFRIQYLNELASAAVFNGYLRFGKVHSFQRQSTSHKRHGRWLLRIQQGDCDMSCVEAL
jgi:hypothetical protein